jgi:hypothetical protein
MAILQRPRLTDGARLLERAFRMARHSRSYTSEGFPMALPLHEFRGALELVGVTDPVGLVIYLDALQAADNMDLTHIRQRIKK